MKFIDDHKVEMECEMNQIFMSEQEFSDYMDEKENKLTETIRNQTRVQTVVELYNKKQISLENAASSLNMTVPQFEDLLKQQRKSA